MTLGSGSSAQSCRATTDGSGAATCTIEDGLAVPNTLITNVAKYHFAHNYHQAVQIVQDLAGGILVTGPSTEDFTSEATRRSSLPKP